MTMRAAIAVVCRRLLPGLLGVLAAGCAAQREPVAGPAPVDPRLAELAWLAGSWCNADGDTFAEEHWLTPRGDIMLGMSRTTRGGQTAFFEYLRIERRPDGVCYVASPLGRCPPTAFKLISQERRRVVFENPEHDFPQRIIYWQTDDEHLHARIEGLQNGAPQSAEWSWRRASARAE